VNNVWGRPGRMPDNSPLDNSPQTTRPQYENTYVMLEKYIFYVDRVIISWKKKKVCFLKLCRKKVSVSPWMNISSHITWGYAQTSTVRSHFNYFKCCGSITKWSRSCVYAIVNVSLGLLLSRNYYFMSTKTYLLQRNTGAPILGASCLKIGGELSGALSRGRVVRIPPGHKGHIWRLLRLCPIRVSKPLVYLATLWLSFVLLRYSLSNVSVTLYTV